jgi:hypothetical protein
MTSVLKVLNRCLVVEFYRQNAGFFGLLFLILFGFIKAGEHIAIGSFLVANPTTLVFLYLAWIAPPGARSNPPLLFRWLYHYQSWHMRHF